MATYMTMDDMIGPESSLQCVICLEVAEDPWQHGKCGRILCKKCLDQHGTDEPCPYCRMEEPQYFEDNRSKRDIQALEVKCSNPECDDTMKRHQLKGHVQTKCLYTIVPCKYKGIGCDTELKRKDMAAHEQDDKLHLHMALETVKALKEETRTLKNSGTITFVLSDYQKKKDANTAFVFSESSFYTHPKGYHMTLRVDANGEGAGEDTHVSVFAAILKGKYDGMLQWPFSGKITITLLNQIEDKNHEVRTFTLDVTHNVCAGGQAWGYPRFIPCSALAHDPVKNTQYLKDDMLYLKLSVEVDGRKPWLE